MDISEGILWALWIDSENVMEWIFHVFEYKKDKEKAAERNLLLQPSVGNIIRYAIFKPNLVVKCLEKLEAWGLLANGLKNRTIFANRECGLLTVMCYANTDINEEIIRKNLNKFSNAHLNDCLMGRNALEHAVDHGNWKSVQLLRGLGLTGSNRYQSLDSTNRAFLEVREKDGFQSLQF